MLLLGVVVLCTVIISCCCVKFSKPLSSSHKNRLGSFNRKQRRWNWHKEIWLKSMKSMWLILKKRCNSFPIFFLFFYRISTSVFLSYYQKKKLSFMVKWFDCFNNWVATWRLGAWGHPRASTADRQLLDEGRSHGWYSLATLPLAPMEEGRKAVTHHTDKSSGKWWLEIYGKTNPMHKKCQCLNWFLNPLKDALHTLYTSQTTRHMTCDPGGCYKMLLLTWMAAHPLLNYSVKLHLTALKLYWCF